MTQESQSHCKNIRIKLPEILTPLVEYKRIDEIYICGGFIRDYLIGGKVGKDIDVFINCNKQELKDLLSYLSHYGRIEYGQYGSPRYYPSSEEEGYYIDIVPFYNFIVSEEPISDITGLLHNFDISANALGLNVKTGTLYDPENGWTDITNRTLRAIRTDFPEKKVSDAIDLSTNTVFWFRLLHFQNRLGFTFDRTTEQWIFENSHRIKEWKKFSENFFEPDISEEILVRLLNRDVH